MDIAPEDGIKIQQAKDRKFLEEQAKRHAKVEADSEHYFNKGYTPMLTFSQDAEEFSATNPNMSAGHSSPFRQNRNTSSGKLSPLCRSLHSSPKSIRALKTEEGEDKILSKPFQNPFRK